MSNTKINMKHNIKSNQIVILVVLFLSAIYLCYSVNTNLHERTPHIIVDDSLSGAKVPDGFWIWTPICKMRAMQPLAWDITEIFRREKYETCSTSEPLTFVKINWTTSEATLFFDETPRQHSSFFKSTCCYEEIIRSGSREYSDEEIKLSSCAPIRKSVRLPPSAEYILVKCESFGVTTYKNTHAIVREKKNIRKRLNDSKMERDRKFKDIRPLSVLMLAIDSASRLSLMPQSAQHLHDTGWFELQGYNKIDDNAFPNLMAILTGYNNTLAYDKCDPRTVGQLNKCPLIWNDFEKSGYVTSYGEDETSMSTFNYQKTGFLKQPTDYYLRPYMIAAEENLAIKRKHRLTFCLGYKHSVDHIFDFAMDFATFYKNNASFGLYWTNTFSHNDMSDPSSVDRKIRSYLDVLENRGILNESMIVFFSDHGLSFGPIRQSTTGRLEERSPFIFIWLPIWFRNEYPGIVRALKINRNRLTNPYDLHMTLKHVLQMSSPDQQNSQAKSCANCQSLFKEIPRNRSCEEISIPAHWCTCL